MIRPLKPEESRVLSRLLVTYWRGDDEALSVARDLLMDCGGSDELIQMFTDAISGVRPVMSRDGAISSEMLATAGMLEISQ